MKSCSRRVKSSLCSGEIKNLTVFGVEKPDEYLTHLYGDWRKLPPIEKQVSHHDFILCDLNKSYLER